MKSSDKQRFSLTKGLLLRLGSHFNANILDQFDSVLNYLEVGHWMKGRGIDASERVLSREELFRKLAAQIGDKEVLYLEFGVASGNSIQYWAQLLRNPRSNLHGFDTFEGLPFAWRADRAKGAFSTGGNPPQIDDPRVKFYKGLFEDTLPHYVPPEHEVLVINVDCDLYSSAICVLNALAPYVSGGTYIHFDEFCDRSNELRAFNDFLASTGKRFLTFGATRTYGQVIFECISDTLCEGNGAIQYRDGAFAQEGQIREPR
jgi:hypothetical protein